MYLLTATANIHPNSTARKKAVQHIYISFNLSAEDPKKILQGLVSAILRSSLFGQNV